MARRQHLTLTVLAGLAIFFTLSYLFSGPGNGREAVARSSHALKQAPAGSGSRFQIDLNSMPSDLLDGDSIAPKLENATLK
jgi:FAD-linked sulfhydryl oxidase